MQGCSAGNLQLVTTNGWLQESLSNTLGGGTVTKGFRSYQLSFWVSLATCISMPSFSATSLSVSLDYRVHLTTAATLGYRVVAWRRGCKWCQWRVACYSPRSAMFITPGALEVVRRLAGSLLV